MNKIIKAIVAAGITATVAFSGITAANADASTANPNYTTKNVKVVDSKAIGKGSKCKVNVTHIGVRGSKESEFNRNSRYGPNQDEYYRKFTPLYGYGETVQNVTQFVNAKLKKNTLVRFRYVNYPATLPKNLLDVLGSHTDYTKSKDKGVNNLANDIRTLYKECSKTKFSLIGYSQGAQVIHEVLRNDHGALAPHELKAIKSVILIADPLRNSKDSTVVYSNPNGLSKDLKQQGLMSPIRHASGVIKSHYLDPSMKDKVISYCIPSDLVCDPNKLVQAVAFNGWFGKLQIGVVGYNSYKIHTNGYMDNPMVISGGSTFAAHRLNK